MTLRKKTLLIIAVTALPLLLVLYVTSRGIVLKSFIRLEEQDAHAHVGRVLSTISDYLASLLNTTGDWAAWDATCEFVEGANPAYIEDNLMNEALLNLRVNLMVFLNASGEIVFEKSVDLETGEEIPVPAALHDHLTPNAPLLRHAEPTSALSGLLALPDVLMLAASRPIVTSDNQGPIRGALIIGRFLDAAEVERLSKIVHLPLRVYPLNQTPPPDVRDVSQRLADGEAIAIRVTSAATLAGYGLLRDMYGKPGVIVRVEIPRSIYRQGVNSVTYFLTFFVTTAAAFGLVMVMLLERLVLSRLARLNQNVQTIRANNDISMRVTADGKDELAHLADGINDMLTTLEHSEILLRNLEKAVETTQVGITISDNDGRIMYTNPADAAMHGYSVAELIGQSAKIFAPPAQERGLTVHERHENFSYWKRERRNSRKDGSTFPALLISNPITDRHGRPLGKVVVCEDITEQQQAEAELLAAHKELQDKNAQLAELNASKDKWFSIIAHDLRTPFTALIVLTETVLEYLDEYSKEELRENMRKIKRSSEAMSALLENLLAWSRLQRGVMEYAPEYLNCMEFIVENLELFASKAEQKGIALRNNLDEELLVYADYHMTNTVIRNLASNALKFTPSGGMVAIAARHQGRMVEFSITDTGTGISAEDLPKLFRLDAQYTNIGTDGERGTGLGLKLCKDLIEKQGGQIWAESELGKGTTFRFTLPRHPLQPNEKNRGQAR